MKNKAKADKVKKEEEVKYLIQRKIDKISC